jgi:hypothetical protein
MTTATEEREVHESSPHPNRTLKSEPRITTCRNASPASRLPDTQPPICRAA